MKRIAATVFGLLITLTFFVSKLQAEENQAGKAMQLSVRNDAYSHVRSKHEYVVGILSETGKPWTKLILITRDDKVTVLPQEEAEKIYLLLATTEAVSRPAPYHYKSQQSTPLFMLKIHYGNDSEDKQELLETVYSTETG